MKKPEHVLSSDCGSLRADKCSVAVVHVMINFPWLYKQKTRAGNREWNMVNVDIYNNSQIFSQACKKFNTGDGILCEKISGVLQLGAKWNDCY